MTDEIVMYDSADAAKEVTITGWVDRRGVFYGNSSDSEHLARWSGCTHNVCKCGEIKEKHRTRCEKCLDSTDRKHYEAMEKKEWDGESMLYVKGFGREYFSNPGEIEDACDDEQIDIKTLPIIICEPLLAKAHQIDPDHFCDSLPTDYEDDLPKEIQEAIDNFNAALIAYKQPLSWYPGKYALKLND